MISISDVLDIANNEQYRALKKSHIVDKEESVMEKIDKKKEIEKIMEMVEKSDISSIKRTIIQILTIINDPHSSAKDLKNIIEVDPPLTAKLLKLANSAFYGYPKSINEIQEAIVCIGFDAVRELALSQKVCELFQDDDYIHGYSRIILWKHCVAVAVCSKLIFRREFRERGENIYVAGLLHDIGIIVIDQFLHEKFKEVLKRSRKERSNQIDLENELLGFDHTDIGLAIAEDWGFPDDIAKAISTHHDPGDLNDENGKIAATMYIANYIVQNEVIGYCDSPYPNKTLLQKCLIKFHLKEKALSLIMKEVKEEIKKMEQADWF